MAKDTDGRRPSQIDQHVGGRVRMRRKLIGVSQEQLADSLAVGRQETLEWSGLAGIWRARAG